MSQLSTLNPHFSLSFLLGIKDEFAYFSVRLPNKFGLSSPSHNQLTKELFKSARDCFIMPFIKFYPFLASFSLPLIPCFYTCYILISVLPLCSLCPFIIPQIPSVTASLPPSLIWAFSHFFQSRSPSFLPLFIPSYRLYYPSSIHLFCASPPSFPPPPSLLPPNPLY